jgi:hypothetical protein
MRASAFKIFILALGLLFLATSCLLTREDLYDKFGEDPTQQGTTSPTPGISVDIGDGLITKEGPVTPGSDSFTMVLDTQPTATVTIGPIISNDTGEVTVFPSSLTFTASNWDIPQTVTVTGVDDAIVDGMRSVLIDLGIASGGDYGGINPGDVTVHNLDDDNTSTQEVILLPGDGLITREHPTTPLSDSFQVVLSSTPTANVTIGTITSTDTGEVTVTPSSLTFTASNWDIPQTVTVTGVDDSDADGMVSVTVNLGSCASSDPSWNGLGVAPVIVHNLDDDKPKGITVVAGSSMLVSENGGFSSFQIVLDARPSANVTIPISSSDITEGTVSTGSLVFSTANWATPQTVTVTGVDDFEVDGNMGFNAVIGAASSTDSVYNGMNPPDVPYQCVDDDAPGVTIAAGLNMLVTESGTTGSFSVMLNSQPSADVSIHFWSNDINEGDIISPAGGTLTFTSGNWGTAQIVVVGGIDDFAIDGNQPFTIVSDSAISADMDYSGINPADISFTNVDDEIPGITVNAGSSMLVTESGTTSSFTVVLMAQPSADVIISLSSSNPAEGEVIVPASGDLTFTSANWSTSQTVTVMGLDDSIVDGNQLFTVVIDPATSGDPHYNGINPQDVTFTNADNDAPGITVIAGSTMLVHESGTGSSFTVVLNSEPATNVDIQVYSGDLSEGDVSVPASGTLTFDAGNWNIPKTVTVEGVDDGTIDGNQSFWVILDPAISGDLDYSGINPQDVRFTCIDDDTAGAKAVSVIAGSQMLVSENGSSSSFQVVLTAAPTDDVEINVWCDDISEGSVSAPALGVITFTTANWNLPVTVTISGVDDPITDGPQPFLAVLDPVTSLDPGYAGYDPQDVSYINVDDDQPGITVLAGSAMLVHESGISSSFSVVLNSEPSGDVSIGVSSTDITEGTVETPASGTLTFTATNWDVLQTVTVKGQDDAVADGPVSFLVQLSDASSPLPSGDPNYDLLTPSMPNVSFTNVDNETPGITVSVGDGLVTREDPFTPTSDTFSIVLNSQPLDDVIIGFTSDNINEVIVSPASVTFTAASWNIAESITVTGVDDFFMDDMQMVRVDILAASSPLDPYYDGMDAGEVYVYNLDDDSLMPKVIVLQSPTGFFTSENGAECEIHLVLNGQPSDDVILSPITSSNPAECTVSPTSVTFTPVTWNYPQTVKVSGVADGGAGDGDQPVDIDFGITSSPTDPNWDGLPGGLVTVTNLDFRGIIDLGYDDTQPPSWATISGAHQVTFLDNDPFDAYSDVLDEGYAYVPIGFPFMFLGQYYEHISVYTNGFASFDPAIDANAFANDYLFEDSDWRADLYVNVLAPWWDDLTTATGAVWYKTQGISPNRVFVLEWENAVFATGGSDDTYSFQIVLHEATNDIDFIYGPMSNIDGSNNETTASAGIRGDRLLLAPDPYSMDAYPPGTKFAAKPTPAYSSRKVDDYPTQNPPAPGTIIRFTQP